MSLLLLMDHFGPIRDNIKSSLAATIWLFGRKLIVSVLSKLFSPLKLIATFDNLSFYWDCISNTVPKKYVCTVCNYQTRYKWTRILGHSEHNRVHLKLLLTYLFYINITYLMFVITQISKQRLRKYRIKRSGQMHILEHFLKERK